MQRFLVLAMLALNVIAMALPTSTDAAEITRLRSSGRTAEAVFAGSDPSGCIYTVVVIVASDGRTQQMGQPNSTATGDAFVWQSDFCEGRALVLAEAEPIQLTNEMFQVDARLKSATLKMQLNAVDYISGTAGPLDVNLTWTANGDTLSVKSSRQLRTANLLINKRLDGNYRPAIAAGIVSFNGSSNFTPEPTASQGTELSSARYGEIEIHH